MPQAMMLHRERYDASNAQALRKVHDAEMLRFSARHELQAGTWTQRVLNRLGPIKSMNGREKMRTALARLGFEIR
jgi:gamma-glutamyl:cysteine ligase YbdK (ATP-grasp superfamily)